MKVNTLTLRQNLPDYSELDLEDDGKRIQETMNSFSTPTLPPLADPVPSINVESIESNHPDLSKLVQIRRQHQTTYAEKGIRRFGREADRETPDGVPAQESHSKRKELAVKMQSLIRQLDQSQARGITTGVDRKIRTESHLDTAAKKETPKSGNQANAEAAAVQRGSKVRFCFTLA